MRFATCAAMRSTALKAEERQRDFGRRRKRYENEIQKLTDETIKKMEEAFAVKEKDIMQV